MAGNGIAVIEVAMFCHVEFDVSIVVEPDDHTTVRLNGLDDSKVAVGDAWRFGRRSELDAVANGETALKLAIDTDAVRRRGS